MTRTKTKKDDGPAVIICRLYDITAKTLDSAIKREGYGSRNEWFQLQASKITGTKTTAEKTGTPSLKSPRATSAKKKSKKTTRAKPRSKKAKEPKPEQERTTDTAPAA